MAAPYHILLLCVGWDIDSFVELGKRILLARVRHSAPVVQLQAILREEGRWRRQNTQSSGDSSEQVFTDLLGLVNSIHFQERTCRLPSLARGCR